MSSIFTIKRLFAGWAFAHLWSGSHSLLLMNAVHFWVAALIYQAIADTARSSGCFEERKNNSAALSPASCKGRMIVLPW